MEREATLSEDGSSKMLLTDPAIVEVTYSAVAVSEVNSGRWRRGGKLLPKLP